MTEPKTLRERTVEAANEIATSKHHGFKQVFVDQGICYGYFQGALHGPPIEFAIEVLEYIAKHGANFTERFDVIAIEALEQLKEARK